jgi:uncharacterized protein (TIGR02145 family)
MSIYLKQFETQAAYEAAESGLILPNVSLTLDNNVIHYKPSTPPTPSHDYVEIGGVKWATMNVGANSVTDTGLYFQWGDTQGYTAAQAGIDKTFDWDHYIWYDEVHGISKYDFVGDKKEILESSDDAATAAWGGNWRMATSEEFNSLIKNTTSAWTNDYQGSGVSGVVLTDITDNSKSIFLPAGGDCNGDGCYNTGKNGYYWTSSVNTEENPEYAWYLSFSNRYVECDDNYERYLGHTIRAILDE